MLSYLDFAKDKLWVRYRASEEPQRLDVDIHTTGPIPVDFAGAFRRRILDMVNYGAAGGSLFDPVLGKARLLSAPDEGPMFGPDYRWSLEIAGVAPIALRTFVEQLRVSGGLIQPVTSMALQGSLPTDGSALSVDADRVRGWLRDPSAYTEEWPSPGFPVIAREVSSGATLRIALDDAIDAALSDTLRTLAISWVNFTSEYLAEHGEHVRVDPGWKLLPSFGLGKREISARYREFPRKRLASRAVIVNMLARFHQTVAPIAEVEVGL